MDQNTTTPPPVITRSCSCGKSGDAIDNCQLCLEYRAKDMHVHDSLILSSLKLAITQAFFQQQYYYHNGGTTYYGGQAADMVRDLLNKPEFKKLLLEVEDFLASRGDEWKALAIEKFTPLVINRAQSLMQSYDMKDKLYDVLREVGVKLAKEALENDEAFKAKIAEVVQSQKYTVEFDVRVRIVEDRPSS